MTLDEIIEHEDFDSVPSLFRGLKLSTWMANPGDDGYDPCCIVFEFGWEDEDGHRQAVQCPEWLVELTKDVFERVMKSESESLGDYTLDTDTSEGTMCIVSEVDPDDTAPFPTLKFQAALQARVKQILS
jgi:hypothetical protein